MLARTFSALLLLPAAWAIAQQLPSTVALSHRFESRAYWSEGRKVPVSASHAALSFSAPPSTDPKALAQAVEEAALKVTQDASSPVLVASARRLRDHGLFLVELGAPVDHATLLALVGALEGKHGITAIHPVLTRMTGRAFADNHLVVTSLNGQLDDVVAAVLAKTGGTLVRKSSIPNTALVAVGDAVAQDAVEASSRLQGLPGLVSAEPELFREYETTATVNDPLHMNQWHLFRPASGDPIPGTGQIFAHDAWETTKGNSNVLVAVFDSGMDVTHEDLAPNIVSMFDPSAGDENAQAECSSSSDGRAAAAGCPSDKPYMESHGTAVAGVIAAKGDNNLGLSGVCPNCSLMAVRLLGEQVGSGLSTAEAFVRAVNQGAWIINNSWGPGRSRYFPMSMSERTAFTHAQLEGRNNLGTVIVFAAGNSTADVASDPYASHPFSIAVAASSNLDDWASYSNYGRAIDVAAPSLGGTTAEDNHGLWTSDVTGDDGYSAESYTADFSGTSGASPVVAGVAGLILSVNPMLTAEQVRLVLTRSADKIHADKIDWVARSGQDINTVFAYDANGHSIGFGYGRVNAAHAVTLAANPGLPGAACTTAMCDHCTPENRCMEACTTQADCVDGTVCDAGVCVFPHVEAGDVGMPCSSACEHCTTTLNSEGAESSMCTRGCMADADCPTGFDCRVMDESGAGLCAVGNRSAGNKSIINNCRSDLFGSSLVVKNGAGDQFCSDVCFSNDPGSCPFGFLCRQAVCTCNVMGQNPCRAYTCEGVPRAGTWPSELCFPGSSFGTVCSSDLNCAPGDYCGGDGACHPDDRHGCSVCTSCTQDSECGVGSACFRANFQSPTGVCTRGCNAQEDCPGSSVCRAVRRRTSTIQLCVAPGDDPAVPCPATAAACTVACRDDVPCMDGKVCQEGACVDAPPDAGVPDAATSNNAGGGGDVGGNNGVTALGGCGCSASDSAPPAAWLLGVLALVVMRRRHTAA